MTTGESAPRPEYDPDIEAAAAMPGDGLELDAETSADLDPQAWRTQHPDRPKESPSQQSADPDSDARFNTEQELEELAETGAEQDAKRIDEEPLG